MTKIITVFYGVTGIFPTIDIYELNSTNSSINNLIINAGSLTEIGGGWYRYDFTTYSPTINYVYTIDGGSSLTVDVRYKVGGNESYVEDISSEVWNEDATNHLISGSTGFTLLQVKADTTSISINQVTLTTLINTMLKYERNRTKIDVVNNTLTVFDDDGSTPLTVFNLKDHLGAPSIAEVAERVPT